MGKKRFYKGIYKKTFKDGSTCIMARFSHDGIAYPVKNLTNLYGITTEKSGFEKLNKLKASLSEGIDPFVSSDGSLNDLFYIKIEEKRKSKGWAESTIKSKKYFYNKYIKDSFGKKKIEKIRYEEVMKIIDGFREDQPDMKNHVIDTLRPMFREAKKQGILQKNIMDDVPKYYRTKNGVVT